jgi:1,4-alpha-glucan branching enzyme
MTKNSKNVVEKPAAKKTAAVKAPKAAAKKAETAAPAKETKTTVKKVAKPAKAAAPKKVAVEFVADCPLATTVSVAGSFNDWAVDKDMLKKNKKTGLWAAKISLVPGDYEYKFVCDGKNWDEGENKIKHV